MMKLLLAVSATILLNSSTFEQQIEKEHTSIDLTEYEAGIVSSFHYQQPPFKLSIEKYHGVKFHWIDVDSILLEYFIPFGITFFI